jgi:Lrp/AsnC family transcriptional regulator, leucine-responsive regulatory protein
MFSHESSLAMPRSVARPRRASIAPNRPDAQQLLLSALEDDGRLSFADLALRIGLSKTAAWARVRELERRGIIAGYHAHIDPAAIGLDIHAFIQVTIRSSQHAEFEEAVIRHPSVIECHTTAGQADYLLHVLAANVADLDSLLRSEISGMPGVERVATTVGMKAIKIRGSIMRCAGRAKKSLR